MSQVLELTDSTYPSFIQKTDAVVFIDFYSDSCAPCQTLLTYLPKIAEHYKDEKVIIAKVNTEKNPKLSAKFMVRSVPLIVLIGEDKMVKKADAGLLTIDRYKKTIDKALGKDVGLFGRLFG